MRLGRKRLALPGVALLLLAAAGCAAERSTAEPARPAQRSSAAALPDCRGCNVLLVSIDTLRADHLGTYGYPYPTSPGLDALGARGVVFERAYSASFVTADAHMSIFTSLPPSVHGVRNAKVEERLAFRLPDTLGTLPEWMKAAGYATAAFTSGGNVGAAYGFDRGMDRYEVHTETKTGVSRTLDFARAQQAQARPFFVFLHTYEAHDPYLPPADVADLFYEPYLGLIPRSRKELIARQPDLNFERQRDAYWSTVDPSDPLDVRQLVAAYDAEIRSIDEALLPLWEALPELGRTLVVVTSDHGEQFGEHGGFLHNDLYDELLHVPLLVLHPDAPTPSRVRTAVSTMDIAPSVLDLLSMPAPAQLTGRSLRPLGGLPRRPVFAERVGRGEVVIDVYDKLLSRSEGGVELFDLARDPSEHHDLGQTQGKRLARLQGTLDALQTEHAATKRGLGAHSVEGQLDERAAAQLRALGYAE